jgi:hypothetical protein
MAVRRRFRWQWGAGAKYLYRELIHALGLQAYEQVLLRLAKPKVGRREEGELAARIYNLRAEGKTVREMIAIFEAQGQFYSKEKVESYLKTRRRKRKPTNL